MSQPCLRRGEEQQARNVCQKLAKLTLDNVNIKAQFVVRLQTCPDSEPSLLPKTIDYFLILLHFWQSFTAAALATA